MNKCNMLQCSTYTYAPIITLVFIFSSYFKIEIIFANCLFTYLDKLLSKELPQPIFFLIQHLHEILEMDMSALKWMLKTFPEEKEEERMRKFLGRYGLTGKQQVGISTFQIGK